MDYDTGEARVRVALSHVDGLTGSFLEVAPLQSGRSLSNIVWVAHEPARDRRYVVRLTNPESALFLGVDRALELDAASTAAAIGIGPEVLYYEVSTGTMVTPWIDSRSSWGTAELRDPARLQQLARAIVTVQERQGDPAQIASTFRRVELLIDSAASLGSPPTDEANHHRARLAEIEQMRIVQPPQRSVLTHHDLWMNNVLDDGTWLWIIDWEFASLGDGLFDLASVSMEGDFDSAADAQLLRRCGYTSEHDQSSLQSMKWVVTLCEAAWSLTKHGMALRGLEPVSADFDHLAHAQWRLAHLD